MPSARTISGSSSIETAYRTGFNPLLAARPKPLPVDAFGLRFDNPVGLAAGLDKNGAHVDALAALGFGFIEVGTTTPRAQPGNPKPRMFRLPEREAVINRLGFNNGGVDALVRNVERAKFSGVLGINIGKNKDTPNERAVDDYLFCLERVYARASYVTINISSPNTQGLRDLQEEETLKRFIGTLRDAQERLAAKHGARKPMLLKIAPDLAEAELDAIADVVLASGIDGLICTNTTIDRAPVAGMTPRRRKPAAFPANPLFEKSTAVLRGMAKRLGGRIPLVGVGGIVAGTDAAAKIDAGAIARAVLHRHGLSRTRADRRMRRGDPRTQRARAAHDQSRRPQGTGYTIVENASLEGRNTFHVAGARAICSSTCASATRSTELFGFAALKTQPRARARRRQQHPVHARLARRRAVDRDARHRDPRCRRRARARPRRSRRELERLRALVARAGFRRAREPRRDSGHGRRRADAEHRRVRRRGARVRRAASKPGIARKRASIALSTTPSAHSRIAIRCSSARRIAT